MITKDKIYKIRSGPMVKIYSLEGRPSAEVHGAFQLENGWEPWSWDLEGKSSTREDWLCRSWDPDYLSDWDLVEVENKNTL